jgi:hypothetical protein
MSDQEMSPAVRNAMRRFEDASRIRGLFERQIADLTKQRDELAAALKASRYCCALHPDVAEERKRQNNQWGGPYHDDAHDWYDWSDYIGKQLSRLIKATNKSQATERRQRFVKIAALAVAALESMDRKQARDAAVESKP